MPVRVPMQVAGLYPTGNACVRDEGQGGLGPWHDDNSPGATCAQVDAANKKLREDAEEYNRQLAEAREMVLSQERAYFRSIEGINDESGEILAMIAGGKVGSFALGRIFGSLLGRSAARVLTSGEMGKIIGWGTGPTEEAAQTVARVASLTSEDVAQMTAKGLTKQWVEKQLNLYKIAETIPSRLTNEQLLPRKALMEKKLSLWK